MRKNKEIYTTRETAELLGVSLRTVQLWVESGVLKAWKTSGGHRRVSRESVEELLAEKNTALNESDKNKLIKVLLIEDDEDLLELYKLRFQQWGLPLQISTAINGYEGLIKIGDLLPDIVILDLLLPNMDGFELIKTLKESNASKNIKIIVVSSLTEDEINEEGGLSSDIKHIRKPVSFDSLHEIIEQTINQVAA